MGFFKVVSAAGARSLLLDRCGVGPQEPVSIYEALDRVLATQILSPEELPAFPRAVVDGFAVRAQDTFGGSPGAPAYLRITGEIAMGRAPETSLLPGAAMRIATGGMVPEGADAVVMVEYTDCPDPSMVELSRACAPGDGLVLPGDDLRKGAPLLPAGRRLRPQDLGLLASVGQTEVMVVRHPVVAVIPTGDEVIPPHLAPGPGQVRDVNTVALCAAVAQAGGVPRPYGIVPDEPDDLRATVDDALATSDLVLLAGGSSVGSRDWTYEVLMALPGAELLFHGVSIRPGKPVIAVAAGGKLLIGLPGNPVSALVVFREFLLPVLRKLSGEACSLLGRTSVIARLSRSVASDAGKEDYVRVRFLATASDELLAEPLLGKSTLLTTLVEADGLVTIPAELEGLEAGSEVTVELL